MVPPPKIGPGKPNEKGVVPQIDIIEAQGGLFPVWKHLLTMVMSNLFKFKQEHLTNFISKERDTCSWYVFFKSPVCKYIHFLKISCDYLTPTLMKGEVKHHHDHVHFMFIEVIIQQDYSLVCLGKSISFILLLITSTSCCEILYKLFVFLFSFKIFCLFSYRSFVKQWCKTFKIRKHPKTKESATSVHGEVYLQHAYWQTEVWEIGTVVSQSIFWFVISLSDVDLSFFNVLVLRDASHTHLFCQSPLINLCALSTKKHTGGLICWKDNIWSYVYSL